MVVFLTSNNPVHLLNFKPIDLTSFKGVVLVRKFALKMRHKKSGKTPSEFCPPHFLAQ